MLKRKENSSKAKQNGHAVGTQCKGTKSLPFSVCLFVSIVQIILHADLLRADTLGNFRWCCNVLAIENSLLFCLKCSLGAFFSSFTGSITDCYLIYIQWMSWLAGTSGNFRGRGVSFLIVTNLLTVMDFSVSCYIPSDLHSLIVLIPVFIPLW